MLTTGRGCGLGSGQALRSRSRMPLVFQLRAAPTWLQTLANELPGQLAGADVALQQREPDLLELRCPRGHKMRVLSWLASAGLSDLQIHEPSLEDVYFGLREAP
jgi:Cu-processing system ATP-binding protein